MPVLKNIIDFSYDGEYLAYSSPDGCLKIWETSTNILVQEYTPSSHLSATCSALSWSPNIHIGKPSKKPKKVKDASNLSTIKDLQLIAMGTLTGDVLLYSYGNADLYSCLTNGHTSIVNDLCWCVTTLALYSCSNDKNITVWDVFTGNIKTKWKADDIPIHSLCLIDSNNLLSASNSIKWWNIKENSLIKTFTGHASEVFRLLPLNKGKDSESSYFLSAAIGDKIISAWQLNNEGKKRAVASFIVSDEPETLSVFTQKDGTTFMSVVCKDGSLHVFEHVLNGRTKKPIKSKFCLQIASKSSDNQSKPQRVPVLCATLSLGLNSCLISYGSFLKPIFEKIDLSEVSVDQFLVRNISLFATKSQEDDITRIKHTNKSESVKVLVPDHLIPAKDVTSIPRKRKKKEDVEELPMEERLRALDLSKIPPNLEEEPALKADSMVHLLLQGLQSKDKNLLNTVLQSSDEAIIQNTLKRLPLPSIILLIQELHYRLSRKEQRNHPYLKWMKNLLSIHLSYLMSCKDIIDHLGPISKLIEARVKNFPKMCQLQGSLKILLSQTSSINVKAAESDRPLAVYQSDSSEESESEENSVNSSDAELQEDAMLEESSSSSSESASEDDMDL